VFQTKPFQKSLVRIGNGIMAHRMRIPMELLKCEPFPKPPHDEQDAIVRFLDHANRRIERYIRAKKKLIALLNEQKQAIIHRAVTRGLDPNVRFKPSGMPWLGEVPEHWKALQLRRMVSLVTSGFTWMGQILQRYRRHLFAERKSWALHVTKSIVYTTREGTSRFGGSPHKGRAGRRACMRYWRPDRERCADEFRPIRSSIR